MSATKNRLTAEQKKKIIDYYFKDQSVKSILESDDDIGNAYDSGEITTDDISDFLDKCHETLTKATI